MKEYFQKLMELFGSFSAHHPSCWEDGLLRVLEEENASLKKELATMKESACREAIKDILDAHSCGISITPEGKVLIQHFGPENGES